MLHQYCVKEFFTPDVRGKRIYTIPDPASTFTVTFKVQIQYFLLCRKWTKRQPHEYERRTRRYFRRTIGTLVIPYFFGFRRVSFPDASLQDSYVFLPLYGSFDGQRCLRGDKVVVSVKLKLVHFLNLVLTKRFGKGLRLPTKLVGNISSIHLK